MLQARFIPCLLLQSDRLVKTVQFKNPVYVGDPTNVVQIYNDKEVDELILLDILSTVQNAPIDYALISEIASEAFMPITYGGGIQNLDQMRRLFKSGIEKISLNTSAIENPEFVRDASREYGSQSVLVSMDVKKNQSGSYEVYSRGGMQSTGFDPIQQAIRMQSLGAGEILLTCIDRDGTWEGYDLELIQKVSSNLQIPLIACGGAGRLEDFELAIRNGASAAALGSMAVFQKKNKGVLINFPSRQELDAILTRL